MMLRSKQLWKTLRTEGTAPFIFAEFEKPLIYFMMLAGGGVKRGVLCFGIKRSVVCYIENIRISLALKSNRCALFNNLLLSEQFKCVDFLHTPFNFAGEIKKLLTSTKKSIDT